MGWKCGICNKTIRKNARHYKENPPGSKRYHLKCYDAQENPDTAGNLLFGAHDKKRRAEREEKAGRLAHALELAAMAVGQIESLTEAEKRPIHQTVNSFYDYMYGLRNRVASELEKRAPKSNPRSKTYYCSKCGREHRSSSKIGKAHR